MPIFVLKQTNKKKLGGSLRKIQLRLKEYYMMSLETNYNIYFHINSIYIFIYIYLYIQVFVSQAKACEYYG